MAKAAAVQSIDPLAELVDQFAPVRLAIEDFRPTQNLHDRLWVRLKVHLEGPQNQPITLKGKLYQVSLTESQIERTVKPSAMERLKKVFGAKRFWELVHFPLKPLDAMFDDEQRKNFVETTQTGPRKIASVEKLDGPANVAKAA